jgi:hypothetical protein
METTIMAGISRVHIDQVTSSLRSPDYKVFNPSSRMSVKYWDQVVAIRFDNLQREYPRWLKLAAAVAFSLTIGGFAAGIIAPGAVAGVFFPTGLVGVWIVGKLASSCERRWPLARN